MESRAADERPVVPGDLTKLILQADKIVVRDSPRDAEAKTIYESGKKEDIAALAKAAQVKVPPRYFHCMCDGTPAIAFYRGKEELGMITNHHGVSMRCSLWSSDAVLADPEAWLKWFDERGMKEPRQEVEEAKARAAERDKAWERWQAAAPKSLRELWQEETDQFGDLKDAGKLLKALKAELPKNEDQIRALYGWYGSGEGPWSGYASYESVAERLLLEYPVAELAAAVQMERMSEAQKEGAARLLGGFDFEQKHPNGRKEIPAAVRAALWDFTKDTKDEFKLGWCRSSFGPE